MKKRKREMTSLIKMLEYIETRLNLRGPLRVEIKALRLKLYFLQPIVYLKGEWYDEDGNLEALLTRVQSVFQNESYDLGRLQADVYQIISKGDRSVPMNLDGLITTMKERLKLLKPYIQEIYTILSKSSRLVADMPKESVMKYLEYHERRIGYVLRRNPVLPVKEGLVAVQKSLSFLRNFLGFAETRCRKLGKLKDLLIHAEIVAVNISCLLYLCCINDQMDDQMISWMKFELLSQIHSISPSQPEVRKIYVNTLKASNSTTCTTMAAEFIFGFLDSLRENLSELLKNNPGFSISVKDQMLALHEELRFLECLVVDSISEKHADQGQKLKDLREHNNILITEAAWVIYSFYDHDENDDRDSERNSLISDLLAKFKIAKEEARQIYDKLVPKSLRSNFPSTNAQGFINSLLRNLKQLLSSKADSIAPLKHHIEPVLEELLSLREDFTKIQKYPSELEELEDQWTCFKDVAYQMEYIIDSFLARDDAIWFHKLGLFDVIEEIKMIRMGLKDIRSKMTDESTQSQMISSFPSQMLLQISPNDELVIFEHECENILEQMTNGSKKLKILSIVGMPGIGKTTLANSIFNRSSITYHFHVRARCCVSKAYDSQRLLLEVIQEVTGQTLQYSDEDLGHQLYQSLKGRRYLIFLDDIWDFELLGNMRLCFPDDGNGSRIMITSRFNNIASQAGHENVAYHLSPLLGDKSWELLQFKLFGKESCPQELREVGKEIAMSCGGLPLTIDLITGILRKIEMKKEFWQEFAQSNLLTNFDEDAQEKCRKVVELSYHHLPYYLRPCFLYFGAFPEDTKIRRRRLEWLWIAEGFVQLPDNDERSLEDVAQSYTDQLISQSLIMVARRASLHGFKKCYIHDLLRDFAVAKAKEERFLLAIDGLSNFSTLSSDSHPWFEQYRLCISSEYREKFVFSNPSGPRVRSVVFCPHKEVLLPISDDFPECPINFSNFRLLRVFGFPGIPVDISPSILQLIHLRFLELQFCESGIFSAMLFHLQNLETLIIKWGITRDYMLSLTDIENMARLRFLKNFHVAGVILPQKILKKPFQFDNLQSLSFPVIRSGEGFLEKLMGPMPHLRSLKCFSFSPRNVNPCAKLDFLQNLESLTVNGFAQGNISTNTTSMPSFPPYLRKLYLSFVYLPWKNISLLGKLEHLEVLKLRSLKSSTGTWDMGFDKQFPKLKFLQLAFVAIREWNATVDDLPCLKRLQLLHCEGLEELPSCLAEILTLQEIVLYSCRTSAAISAEKIKREQEEMGNLQLLVKICDITDEDTTVSQKRYYEKGLAACPSIFENLTDEELILLGIASEMEKT